MSATPRRTTGGVCLVAVMLLVAGVACDRETRHFSRVKVLAPTAPVTAVISPQRIVLSPLGAGRCGFTSAFDLLIDHQSRSPLFLDQVTIRLLDGSSVGGSPVLMSSSDLAARFGSTVLRPGTNRRFGLTPRFGCESFVPRSLATEIVLRDGSGDRQTLTLMVSIG